MSPQDVVETEVDERYVHSSCAGCTRGPLAVDIERDLLAEVVSRRDATMGAVVRHSPGERPSVGAVRPESLLRVVRHYMAIVAVAVDRHDECDMVGGLVARRRETT